MKRIILLTVVTVFMAGTMFMSCQSSAEKVDQAKEDVVQAKQDLNQAIKDSIIQFKQESEMQISANEKRIAEFRTQIVKEKKDIKETYEKSLAELEQKNNELKDKLIEFKENETDKWKSFKSEFNRDMNDLGSALKNFTIKNK